jgi:hypothetical protein
MPSEVSFSDETALCTYRGWDKNVNYLGPINEQNSTCHGGEVWNTDIDIGNLIDGRSRGPRSIDRMMASFKYILMLLTGKPY